MNNNEINSKIKTYDFATELKFTEVYKKHKNDHPALREAACLAAQYPDYFSEIEDDDLIAGRIDHGLVGFSPDEWGSTAFGYYILPDEITRLLEYEEINDEHRSSINEMLEFWKTENTSAKLRAAYPPEMAKYLPTDDWMNQSGIAFPLYRLTGSNVNFDKLLQLGIPGLRKELKSYLDKKPDTPELYAGMLKALDVLVSVIKYYEKDAREKAEESTDELRTMELERLAESLNVLTLSRPKTYIEAVQLFWLYSLNGDIRNYGRMDVYLGDFLVSDLESGTLNKAEALRITKSLWRLIADRDTRVHGRVIIGGKGRRNEKSADEFALLAMEATRNVHEVEPQLSLRIYDGMNEEVYEKALDVIGEGRTYPILYNDDVNIKSVSKAFEFDEMESQQYVPYGCGEYILEHESFNTPSGVINLLKALEITLHNGTDPVTGKEMGLSLGNFESFETFDDLLSAYKKQVEHYVRLMADQEMLEYKIAGEEAPFLFTAMLYDECLQEGKGFVPEGVKYLCGALESYGNSNAADSLTAIKKLVYEDKKITASELLEALDANFEGCEDIRKELKNAPKYGNDNEEADNMLLEVHNHLCNYVRDQKDRTELYAYLVVIINNSANTLMGHSTAASADGRFSGTSMNNGNAPSNGADKNGITAVINSVTKPSTDIHAGAVQNFKFSKALFREKREELKALLKTYWQKGGAQAMITVVNKGDLEKAMEEPEKYQHIFVRVGGFSARFVELSKDVQLDILNRTLH